MQELVSVEEPDDESREPSAIDELFAEAGLVGDHASFILKNVDSFHRQYRWLGLDELIREAVRLARQAEKHFKPELGFKFATLLRWYLKGLHRYARRHSDYRPRRKAEPGAIHRISPIVKLVLVLNTADQGFVQKVIEYRKLADKQLNDRPNDSTVLCQVAKGRIVRFEPLLIEAAKAERPRMSDNEAAVLDWLLSATDNRTLTQVAQDFGLTKGAVSKIRTRIIARLELWCDRRSRSARIIKDGNLRASACHI